jgi:hypothetical protein
MIKKILWLCLLSLVFTDQAYTKTFSLSFESIDAGKDNIFITAASDLPEGAILNAVLFFQGNRLAGRVPAVRKGLLSISFKGSYLPGEYVLEVLFSPEFQTSDEVLGVTGNFAENMDGFVTDGAAREEKSGNIRRFYITKKFMIGTAKEAEQVMSLLKENFYDSAGMAIKKMAENFENLRKFYVRTYVKRQQGVQKDDEKNWEEEMMKFQTNMNEIKEVVSLAAPYAVTKEQKELDLVVRSRMYASLMQMKTLYVQRLTQYEALDKREKEELGQHIGFFRNIFEESLSRALTLLGDPDLSDEIKALRELAEQELREIAAGNDMEDPAASEDGEIAPEESPAPQEIQSSAD